MPLNAGEMNCSIVLEQQTTPEDVDRERFPLEGWEPLARVYAARIDQSGGEEYGSYEIAAVATTVFRFFYRRDMDPERIDVTKLRRVVAEGQTFNIVHAHHVGGRRVGIELVTTWKGDRP